MLALGNDGLGAVVDSMVVAGLAGELSLLALEDVAGTTSPGVLSAGAGTSRDTEKRESARRKKKGMTRTTQVRNRVEGGNSRFDILAQTGLAGVHVLGHVASATAAGGDDGALQSGSQEVLRVGLGGVGNISHVAGAAASVRGQHFERRSCGEGGERDEV